MGVTRNTVEVLGEEIYANPMAAVPWHRSVRFRLFATVFVLVLVPALIWIALQPSVYRSSATVLMGPAAAVDAPVAVADRQNLAIQRSVLLGADITISTVAYLNDQRENPLPERLVRSWMRVDAVADTNLMKMVVEGPDPQVLPPLLNAWIDTYTRTRESHVTVSQGETVRQVREELDGLNEKVAEARAALGQFRVEHNLISPKREENAVLSRQQGLSKALHNALEARALAASDLAGVESALRTGRPVVTPGSEGELAELTTALQTVQAEQAEAQRRYTASYISKQPDLRALPQRIAKLEGQIDRLLERGRSDGLAMAQQKLRLAQETVRELERQMEEQESQLSTFSESFIEHDALVAELEGLESLARETQARLVRVEVRRIDQYPQVSVVDGPAVVAERVGPDYRLYCGGAFLGALLAGLAAVWLYGFLGHRAPPMHEADLAELRYRRLPDEPHPSEGRYYGASRRFLEEPGGRLPAGGSPGAEEDTDVHR